MTIQQLAQALNGIADTAHIEFDTPPTAPYIAYYETPSQQIAADAKVLHEIKNITIEIYCRKNDYETVDAVKRMLTEHLIVYNEVNVIWLNDLKLVETVLDISL